MGWMRSSHSRSTTCSCVRTEYALLTCVSDEITTPSQSRASPERSRRFIDSRSFRYYQYYKAVGKNRPPWMRVIRRSRRRRAELRGYNENVVCLRVQRQRARSLLCRDIFRHAELVRRFFFHHRQHAFTAGGECQPGLGIERRCIHAVSDGRSGQHFSAVGVDDGHHLVVAADKEPAIFAVNRKPARFRTG